MTTQKIKVGKYTFVGPMDITVGTPVQSSVSWTGLVTQVGSDYTGECKQILGVASVRVPLSSCGWGDSSDLTIDVPYDISDADYLAQANAALAAGHDVDLPVQTKKKLLARLALAKTELLSRLDAKPVGTISTYKHCRKCAGEYMHHGRVCSNCGSR